MTVGCRKTFKSRHHFYDVIKITSRKLRHQYDVTEITSSI